MKKLFQFGPVARISTGVISLILAMVLIVDALLGVLPNPRRLDAEQRAQMVNMVASQINRQLSAGDAGQVQALLDSLVGAPPALRSIGIRSLDTTLLLASPTHAHLWKTADAGSTLHTHVTLPINSGDATWGSIELLFHPSDRTFAQELLREPSLALALLLGSLGFIAVYLYLRRALYQLNPSNAVPQHVRNAFGTLAEAVLILDRKGRIMLANASFLRISDATSQELEGKPLASLAWLMPHLERSIGPFHLWDIALREREPTESNEIELTLPNANTMVMQLHCSTITDGTQVARGYLLSFDDVTELSHSNAQLREAMHELQESRDQIARQNVELQKVAHHDHLTGCLNRRAFFERAEPLFVEAKSGNAEFCCIMVDIDHFKSFNDTHGHAVGDLVIQQVAKTLGRGLRLDDILCRFGGEEFCIVLPNTTAQNGLPVAERLRASIEQDCGPGVRAVAGLKITASLGFVSLQTIPDATTLQALIERADNGLYAAKRGGRNRVGDGAVAEVMTEHA